MNWRRGFFRMWLILSVAWIVGVGLFAVVLANDGYQPLSSAETVIYYPSSDNVDGGYSWGNACYSSEPRAQELDVEKYPFEQITAKILVICEPRGNGETWADAHIRAGTMPVALQTIEQAVLQHDRGEREELWELLAYAAVAAVFAPLVVLATGSSIAWALKGFTTR